MSYTSTLLSHSALHSQSLSAHCRARFPRYDSYNINIKRVDAIRYFLLYHCEPARSPPEPISVTSKTGPCAVSRVFPGTPRRHDPPPLLATCFPCMLPAPYSLPYAHEQMAASTWI